MVMLLLLQDYHVLELACTAASGILHEVQQHAIKHINSQPALKHAGAQQCYLNSRNPHDRAQGNTVTRPRLVIVPRWNRCVAIPSLTWSRT
jgi:hypothetical protein